MASSALGRSLPLCAVFVGAASAAAMQEPPAATAAPAPETGRITAVAKCPKVPEGFAIELVLHHPDIKWPSAVHCREDGSLLVAEDPMDMPGPTDQPLDRIFLLRFMGDGTFTKTLFAEKLFAVMGIQEIDDAIYVMNMPHLTVLRDRNHDGVAEERTELITNLGPPAPGHPGGFNDHIVSGLRLGMDGFLYVSVGDKGIPKATGTDGSTVTLRGGGVVRVRPDGSMLELVASGTRNHLDVVMDEQDNIFTYDNTDDGLGWWTRVTHIIPTGYYGYPWDYHDHPERMLPPMTDYGGGSPVGGLCYREDAWPEEFHGNLFWCEWAKQAIRRIVVEPTGATFKVVHAEDFITPGESGEFRPLDICESADGRYLYIADWNHPGWVSPQVAGRVWRVRRVEDRAGAPPNGRMKDTTYDSLAEADNIDLLDSLDHPSFRRRLAAQRELTRRGDLETLQSEFKACIKTEVSPLLGADRARRKRRHLLWAITECTQVVGIVPFASDSPDARAQASRAAGTWRCQGAVTSLDGMLTLPDAVVVRDAAIALGRIGDPKALWPLVRTLDATDDPFVRFAIRQAIRALRAPRWDVLLQKFLTKVGPRAQEDLWLALRELYDAELVRQLAVATGYDFYTPAQRARAVAVLAEAHRKTEPWNGKWWSIDPARHPPPAKVVEWEGTPVVLAALTKAFESPDAEVRAAALEAARTTREETLLPCVRETFARAPTTDERVRVLAILRELKDAGCVPLLQSLLATPGLDPAVRTAAIDTASALATPECAALLEHLLDDPAVDVRAAAVGAFFKVRGNAGLLTLEPRLADPAAAVRNAVLRAYGSSTLPSVTKQVTPLLADAATHDAAIDAMARHPDAKALDAYLAGLAAPDAARRDACRHAIVAIRGEVRALLEEKKRRGELAPELLRPIRSIYDTPQPIVTWSLLGPFDRDQHVAGLEGGFGGPLAAAFVKSYAGKEGAKLHARDAQGASPHGFIDLRKQITDDSSVAAYAFSIFESPIARTARMAVGSDDSLFVWVNGRQVFEFPGDRGWGPDQNAFDVPLEAGQNTILLRIEQGGGDFSFNAKITDLGTGPLFEDALPTLPPEAFRAFALAHAGDAARGKSFFHDERGPGCFKCHPIAGVGTKVGPDLRDVGAKYPRAELIASLLEPSARIAEGYTATNLFLKDGDILSGLVIAEKEGELTLVDAIGTPRQIRLADVESRAASTKSAMPVGLTEAMTLEQFADLVAYLESLRQ